MHRPYYTHIQRRSSFRHRKHAAGALDVQQEEVRQGLSDKISDLENFYADSVLGDELKELYAEVQMKCIDFRTNVFMKNLEHLDEKFVSVYFY